MGRWTQTVVVVIALGAPACSMTATGGSDTLPALARPQAAATTTSVAAVDGLADDWYATHLDAIGRQREDLELLVTELAAVDLPAARVDLCAAGLGMEGAGSTEAREAPHAHPDWVRAVDLARWMVARCSRGDLETLAAILPELTETLARFDAWRSTRPASAGAAQGVAVGP